MKIDCALELEAQEAATPDKLIEESIRELGQSVIDQVSITPYLAEDDSQHRFLRGQVVKLRTEYGRVAKGSIGPLLPI